MINANYLVSIVDVIDFSLVVTILYKLSCLFVVQCTIEYESKIFLFSFLYWKQSILVYACQ